MAQIDKRDPQFDAIVNEVVSEAHLGPSLLSPEELAYLREHSLNKPLGVIHIWALGVGLVITGMHPTRRTPHVALVVWTAVTILFILFGHSYERATAVAILISTLTAVTWYVLAIVCLIILRRKEPELFRPYKVPVYPSLPVFIAVLAAIAGSLYA